MNNAELLKELRIDQSQREDHDQGVKRWPWIVGAFIFLLLLGGATWMLTGQRAVTVKTAQALSSTSGNEAGAVLQATGYITARRRATVSAQITGTLTEVLIEEGDHVSKGQVMARLNDSANRAALDTAKAQAAVAHALVAQVQAQLAQNIRDLERMQSLYAQKVVSEQKAEQARTLVDSTRAQLVSHEKQAASADAQAAQAQVNFDYCVIRAPFAGVVTSKDAQVGEIISPFSSGGFTRTGVGTIVDMDSLEIDVDVSEAYIGRVKPDMPAEAVLDAYPDWKIPAHVIAIVPSADRGKATIKVRVAIELKDARIVPDMGVRVAFLEPKTQAGTEAPRGVLVPANAIVQRNSQSVVFVVNGDKVAQRTVTPTAESYGDMKLLPSGVAPGDSVVVSPPEALHDGSAIKIEEGNTRQQ